MMESGQQHKENDRGGSKNGSVRGIVCLLLALAAGAVLAVLFLCPVLQVFDNPMAPAVPEGSYVVSVKGADLKNGDVCAFYCSNKILVRRVIAQAGEWVDIDENGTVYVNDQKIDEPYVSEPADGYCEITLPYQVPELTVFVMGDQRDNPADSRSEAIGCVPEDQILGKIAWCVWPLNHFGLVK